MSKNNLNFDELVAKVSQVESDVQLAMHDLRLALQAEFQNRPDISDIQRPDGLRDLLLFATHPLYSSASFSTNYNALSGEWHVYIGSTVHVKTGGPDFSMGLAAGLLQYHGKNIPHSANKFLTFLGVDK